MIPLGLPHPPQVSQLLLAGAPIDLVGVYLPFQAPGSLAPSSALGRGAAPAACNEAACNEAACNEAACKEKEIAMSIRLYVRNLATSVTDEQLTLLFARYGEVTVVRVATEPGSRRSRGFGWVYMTDEAEARTAIAGLSGKIVGDQVLSVTEARTQG